MPRMLLCFDGSEHALRATSFLIEFSRVLKDPEISILNVQSDPSGLGTDVLYAFNSLEEAESSAREQGGNVLRRAEELLELSMSYYAYSTHVRLGPVAESIVGCAADLACDLIVMGSRGRGSLAGAVLGSVTIKVLHHSTVPVLVVR